MKFYSEKIIKLPKADIHLHYANNRGRGTDNVTVTIVNTGTTRPAMTKEYIDYLHQYRTSGWKGNVNIKNSILAEYN